MNRDILVVDSVTKRFGGLRALGGDNGLSFTVQQGTFLGLIGPNGAGKSTTFNIISGVIKPNTGAVYLNGQNLSETRTPEIAAYGLGENVPDPKGFPVFIDFGKRDGRCRQCRRAAKCSSVWPLAAGRTNAERAIGSRVGKGWSGQPDCRECGESFRR